MLFKILKNCELWSIRILVYQSETASGQKQSNFGSAAAMAARIASVSNIGDGRRADESATYLHESFSIPP